MNNSEIFFLWPTCSNFYLIIFRKGDDKNDGRDIVETCDPFSALRTLTSDIDDPKLGVNIVKAESQFLVFNFVHIVRIFCTLDA